MSNRRPHCVLSRLLNHCHKDYWNIQGEYYHLGSLQKVDNKIVKDWHSFFIKNQEKYCLSMYYQVKKNRISGITFFKGQSLSYPCPLEKEEVEECLKTMLDKINKRADLILNRYNEEHKSNS